jgi:hypothetical protein
MASSPVDTVEGGQTNPLSRQYVRKAVFGAHTMQRSNRVDKTKIPQAIPALNVVDHTTS